MNDPRLDILAKMVGKADQGDIKKSLTPEKPPRTVGNIYAMIEAQRIYNPNMPSIPEPKNPPASMQDKGTAPAMDATGPWGTPNNE